MYRDLCSSTAVFCVSVSCLSGTDWPAGHKRIRNPGVGRGFSGLGAGEGGAEGAVSGTRWVLDLQPKRRVLYVVRGHGSRNAARRLR